MTWPIMYTGYRVSRLEGGLFLFFFAGYTTFRLLQEKQVAAASTFQDIVVWGVVPITVLVVMIQCWRFYRSQQTQPTTEKAA